MKITTKKYGDVFVRWQYNLKENGRDITKAFLEVKDGRNSMVLKEIFVQRKPSEKYVKQLAREFAFRRLLQESFSREGTDLQDRQSAWTTFRTSCKQFK